MKQLPAVMASTMLQLPAVIQATTLEPYNVSLLEIFRLKSHTTMAVLILNTYEKFSNIVCHGIPYVNGREDGPPDLYTYLRASTLL
jgi:transcriptional regulator of heat shock response